MAQASWTAAAGDVAGLADEVLLERYTAGRDEAAFAALVRRYGPLVLAVCRRALGHEQDAEDAFQATFCVLARKAGSISRRGAVGAWLHAVAYRIARKARAGRGRRPVYQSNFPDLPAAEGAPGWVWMDLWAVLDEELSRLPDKLRLPFVLCHLEGRTNEQAAAQLGCPLGTVRSRLARARDRLRGRLTRRGLVLSAGLLAAALARPEAFAEVRAGLVDAAVRAASHYAAGKPAPAGPLPAGVAALADSFLRARFWARLGTALGSLAALGIGAALVSLALHLPRGARPAGGPPAPGPAASARADREGLQGAWKVVGAESDGKAMPPRGLRMTFEDGQWTMAAEGFRSEPMPFVLDPAGEPKGIDLPRGPGVVWQGIYRLDGDSLKLCVNRGGGGRPTDFVTKPGSNCCLFVLERERPARGAAAPGAARP
jgi:RNA polymerase sigma factor (sigma-70 family)